MGLAFCLVIVCMAYLELIFCLSLTESGLLTKRKYVIIIQAAVARVPNMYRWSRRILA